MKQTTRTGLIVHDHERGISGVLGQEKEVIYTERETLSLYRAYQRSLGGSGGEGGDDVLSLISDRSTKGNG